MVTVVQFPRPATPAVKAVEDSLAYYTPERPAPKPQAQTALEQMYAYYSAA